MTAMSSVVLRLYLFSFPSIDRARKFQFKYPILYITGNRREREDSIYVFEIDDLEELREEMKDEMWWIPGEETNPRGFGIKAEAVRRLMEKARSELLHD